MDFCSFDADYLSRLRNGDPATQQHYATYFGELLTLRLRSKLRSPQLIEDIRQETLFRVLDLVRRGRVEYPERFGGFVYAVSQNVLREMVRGEAREEGLPEGTLDMADPTPHLDGILISEQRKEWVREVLNELPEKDRRILHMCFLEEGDRKQIARQLQVTEEYLRVVLHRAKKRFREKSTGEFGTSPPGNL